ncbi:hypothetical protein DB88DRAFT_285127 [Papiliotrema laurentii]|uniref:Uncharacterized protein n=1 Tax=Papiliotrema laurentii TaxID=5418 RepID=A0AAD9D1C0_PAPLA|nr:hypothetical protein DB88DRAFT_285127 [Papiliotrema laurentii]
MLSYTTPKSLIVAVVVLYTLPGLSYQYLSPSNLSTLQPSHLPCTKLSARGGTLHTPMQHCDALVLLAPCRYRGWVCCLYTLPFGSM